MENPLYINKEYKISLPIYNDVMQMRFKKLKKVQDDDAQWQHPTQ